MRVFMSQCRPYLEAGYTLWHVARKRGMPQGHTMADIAADYAGLIADEFEGQVDLVVGMSYGGMVGLYLAANHPGCFAHIAIVIAGHSVSEPGKAIDVGFARALSEGRPADAMATMLEGLTPSWFGRWLARPIGATLGPLAFREQHTSFASDVLIEAEAEAACDARDVLSRIEVPVLLVCGDADVYFPAEIIEETARLIPDSTLKLYPGKGHMRVASDQQVAYDVLDFVGRKSSSG
jgi:pimeloyl-ACP methyl ester carboxylesterase